MDGYSKDDLQIKYRGYNDLYYLVKYILGYDRLVYRLHKDLCDFIQYTKADILDLEPRDHFKSTCITIGYPIFCLINDPNEKIKINHKILGKARQFLSAIKTHFESNKQFKYYYGNYVGEPWGQAAITVCKRTKIVTEPSISTGAVGHEDTGGHYNKIINDDIVGLKDRYSAVERENTLNYYKSIRYLKDKGSCKEINIGTRWHQGDVYDFIINKRKTVTTRIKKAEVEEKIPYFPERYTWEDLKELEDEDPILYASQMMNEPRPLENQLYNIDKLKKFEIKAFNSVYNIGYIDPAFGRRSNNEPCYFSFPIVSIINDQIYVLEWITNKKTPEENELLILAKAKEYKLRRLGVESNAAQSLWADKIKKMLKEENIIINIEYISHSMNKDRRIEGMHGTVKNNVNFREDWDIAYKEAMSQLLSYPQHKYKDAPDALEGVVSMAIIKKEPRIRIL